MHKKLKNSTGPNLQMQKYKITELSRNRNDSELKWTGLASKVCEFGLDLEWVVGSYLSILKKKIPHIQN